MIAVSGDAVKVLGVGWKRSLWKFYDENSVEYIHNTSIISLAHFRFLTFKTIINQECRKERLNVIISTSLHYMINLKNLNEAFTSVMSPIITSSQSIDYQITNFVGEHAQTKWEMCL